MPPKQGNDCEFPHTPAADRNRHQGNSKHDGEQNSRLAVAMVAARLLMRYWLISGSTSIAKFRNDSCHPR